jgi:hypothetical protein
VGQNSALLESKQIVPQHRAEISSVYQVFPLLCNLPPEPALVLGEPTFGQLIAFRVYNYVGQKGANQLCKQLYGQGTSTRGKMYRRKGLLDEIPHRKRIRGVIVLSTRDANEVVKSLREFNEVHVRDVTLTPEDRKGPSSEGGVSLFCPAPDYPETFMRRKICVYNV